MFCHSCFRTKFKRGLTKTIAMVVVMSMLSLSISPATYAFAKTNTVNQQSNKISNVTHFTITPNDDGSISIKDKNKESIIKVHETYDTRTVIVTDKKTGNSNKLIFDKKTNTIFSTYTGKTVQLNDSSLERFRRKRSAENDETCYVSWRTIKNAVGPFANYGSIAAELVMESGFDIRITIVAAAVYGILGITSIAIPDDDNHGIAFKIGRGKHCFYAGYGAVTCYDKDNIVKGMWFY